MTKELDLWKPSKYNREKKNPDSLRKWAKDVRGHFTDEDLQMAKWYTRRCLVSLAVRDVRNEATVRHGVRL